MALLLRRLRSPVVGDGALLRAILLLGQRHLLLPPLVHLQPGVVVVLVVHLHVPRLFRPGAFETLGPGDVIGEVSVVVVAAAVLVLGDQVRQRHPVVIAVVPVLFPILKPLRRLGRASHRTLRRVHATPHRGGPAESAGRGSTVRGDQRKLLDNLIGRGIAARTGPAHQPSPQRGRRGHVAGLRLRRDTRLRRPSMSRLIHLRTRLRNYRFLLLVGFDVDDLVRESAAAAASVIADLRGTAPAFGGLSRGPAERLFLLSGWRLLRVSVLRLGPVELGHETAVGVKLVRRPRRARQELPILTAQPVRSIGGSPPVPG
mmetsp:Transcript_3691/g.16986  ORF Transcript_3691/g.16986 Transcript_3691/m.16986 type:complete len:316 (+) Transcript_3691:2235-3182(+)